MNIDLLAAPLVYPCQGTSISGALMPSSLARTAASACVGPSLGCCSGLRAVTRCLVTAPCSSIGVLLTLSTGRRSESWHRSQGRFPFCLLSPAGGQNSSARSLFLHLPRILARLGLNFDEVVFCRCGCLFFQCCLPACLTMSGLRSLDVLVPKTISSY